MDVRLAYGGGPKVVLSGWQLNDVGVPAVLVSYAYLDQFQKIQDQLVYRDWVLDSGAFTAHASGSPVDLSAYIECCKELLASDDPPSEIFALDVIGDWKGSLRNCEAMRKEGIEAIPCFHLGSPEAALMGIAGEHDKIALGGAVGARNKDAWAAQCFARVWPKKIHGFGFGSERSIMAVPWHSVDATSWELGPCRFGRWNAYGGNVSVRGSRQNLRAEVEWYMRLEQKAQRRWRKQMAKLDSAGPSVRLAASGGSQSMDRYKALMK